MKRLFYFLFVLVSILTLSTISNAQSIGCDSCNTQAKGVTVIGKAISFKPLTITQSFKNYWGADTMLMLYRDAATDSPYVMWHGHIYPLSSGGGGGSVTLTENQIAYGSPSNTVTSSDQITYNPSTGELLVGAVHVNTVLRANNQTFFAAIGDVSGQGNEAALTVDDPNGQVIVKGNFDGVSGYGNMLFLDGQAHLYSMGDIDNIVNNTKLTVDDVNKVIISTNAVALPTMTVVTTGGSATMPNGFRGMYYDPASLVTAATITLPSAPLDGEEVEIRFGGTITAGQVVTALTIAANSGQALVGFITQPFLATSQGRVIAKYRAGTSQWYVTLSQS